MNKKIIIIASLFSMLMIISTATAVPTSQSKKITDIIDKNNKIKENTTKITNNNKKTSTRPSLCIFLPFKIIAAIIIALGILFTIIIAAILGIS